MKKSLLIYFLVFLSFGYLIYNYFFTDISYGMMNHHYGYYDNYNQTLHYLDNIFMFLAYFVLAMSIIFLVNGRFSSNDNTLDILNKRLSKGEISIEQYQSIKDAIKGNR